MIAHSYIRRQRIVLIAVALLAAFGRSPAEGAASQSFSTLHRFAAPATPPNGLTKGNDGNFYGTTTSGGDYNNGTVFQLTPSGGFTTLYSFGAAPGDGANPGASLLLGPDGNFYGTTAAGGASQRGIIFKITPSGAFTLLQSFDGSGDAGSSLALTSGRDGNFYGTTTYGGAYSRGTVFRITPEGALTTLYNFGRPTSADGASPLAGLVEGPDGNYYGTTSQGGANGCGTAFRITSSGAETVLYSFALADGCAPWAALALGSDGNFYGTTTAGGASGYGTVFQLTPSGAATVLYSFQGSSNGNVPLYPSTLVLGGDGSFYGTTYQGGPTAGGTLFKITPAGAETLLCTFDHSAGPLLPSGALAFASDGSTAPPAREEIPTTAPPSCSRPTGR